MKSLSDVKFLVLTELMQGVRSGREIREELEKQSAKKSLAAFYQIMARMEDEGMIRGWYETKRIDDQTVKSRHYEILGSGRVAWEKQMELFNTAASKIKWGIA